MRICGGGGVHGNLLIWSGTCRKNTSGHDHLRGVVSNKGKGTPASLQREPSHDKDASVSSHHGTAKIVTRYPMGYALDLAKPLLATARDVVNVQDN